MKDSSLSPSSRLGGAVISDRVVAALLQELRTGRYADADRLPAEVDLAAQLGVSRTVIRDALSEMERAGYIERVRGIGTLVNRDVVQLKNRMDQKLEFYKMIRAIGKEMGYEVEVQNIGFDGLIPALQAKNIDVIISGMTINDERKQNVSFSDPYYQSGLTMVVRSDEQAIKSFQDLKGHKVAVQIGTTSAEAVKKLGGVEVKELNTPADCFMELKGHGVDAVVNDRPVNDYYITKSGETGVKALEEKLTAEDYGIALAKDNTELQSKINEALKKLKENGEYDKIYAKWFGGQK